MNWTPVNIRYLKFWRTNSVCRGTKVSFARLHPQQLPVLHWYLKCITYTTKGVDCSWWVILHCGLKHRDYYSKNYTPDNRWARAFHVHSVESEGCGLSFVSHQPVTKRSMSWKQCHQKAQSHHCSHVPGRSSKDTIKIPPSIWLYCIIALSLSGGRK